MVTAVPHSSATRNSGRFGSSGAASTSVRRRCHSFAFLPSILLSIKLFSWQDTTGKLLFSPFRLAQSVLSSVVLYQSGKVIKGRQATCMQAPNVAIPCTGTDTVSSIPAGI